MPRPDELPDVQPLYPGTYIMPVAPEIQALYSDPRIANIRDQAIGLGDGHWTQILPDNPPKRGESRFLLMENYAWDTDFEPEDEVINTFRWLNEDFGSTFGGGIGFAGLKQKPRMEITLIKKAKSLPPEVFVRDTFMIVAPRFISLLQNHGVGGIETLEIEFTASTPSVFRDYQFFDLRILLLAYDYSRSAVQFQKHNGEIFGLLGTPRCFRDDLPADAHFFHDFYKRREFIMSRSLAFALREAGVRGLSVNDPVTGTSAFMMADIKKRLGHD